MAGPTSAERGRDVRRRLLTAAAELIPRRGWRAVSTRVLAEHAGVRPGLVHYHFPSLESLLQEAALLAMRAVLDGLRPVFASAPTSEAALSLLLGKLDEYPGDDPESLLFVEAYLAAARDPGFRRELAEILVGFRSELARWLAAQGQAAPEETAAVLAAAVDGLLLHRVLSPDPGPDAVAPVLHRLLTPERLHRPDDESGNP